MNRATVLEPIRFQIDQSMNQAMTIDLSPFVKRMSDEQFYRFCVANPELRIERKANGEIVIMTPEGGESGGRNATIVAALHAWARQNGEGIAFGSSTGFILPNRATYSPDAAWVRRSRLAGLSRKQKQQFIPLCPDFVVELRSVSDRLHPLQQKMQEYMDNGAQLGWLIDPTDRTVYVYRPGQPAESLQASASISAEPLLPDFVLDLEPIWDPGF